MEKSEFRFLNYKIVKIESFIAEDFGKEEEHLQQNIEVTSKVSEKEPRRIKIFLTIKIISESEKIRFVVVVVGYFEANKDMPDELFENLCKINAPAILLPYARSIVTNFTALCNIKPIILPLFNLTKKED